MKDRWDEKQKFLVEPLMLCLMWSTSSCHLLNQFEHGEMSPMQADGQVHRSPENQKGRETTSRKNCRARNEQLNFIRLVFHFKPQILSTELHL